MTVEVKLVAKLSFDGTWEESEIKNLFETEIGDELDDIEITNNGDSYEEIMNAHNFGPAINSMGSESFICQDCGYMITKIK